MRRPRLPTLSTTVPRYVSLSLAVVACGPALRAESAGPQTAQSAASSSGDASAPDASAAPPDRRAPGEPAQDEARRGARTWLALVDQGHYAESWDAAARLFQSSTTKEQWDSAAQRVRQPLGELSTRRFRAAEFHTQLTGAPEGKYFVVHYDSAFAKKPSAREIVTLKQAPDASWKVAGYFVE